MKSNDLPKGEVVPLSAEQTALINALVGILRPDNPKLTAIKLQKAIFGLSRKRVVNLESLHGLFGDLKEYADAKAMLDEASVINVTDVQLSSFAALHEASIQISVKRSKEVIKALKVVEKQAVALMEALNHTDLALYSQSFIDDEDRGSLNEIYLDSKEILLKLRTTVLSHQKRLTRPVGRQPTPQLREFVEFVIDLYEKTSKKKFTLSREKESKTPTSMGYQFVLAVVEHLSKQFEAEEGISIFNEPTVYNLCEKIISTRRYLATSKNNQRDTI